MNSELRMYSAMSVGQSQRSISFFLSLWDYLLVYSSNIIIILTTSTAGRICFVRRTGYCQCVHVLTEFSLRKLVSRKLCLGLIPRPWTEADGIHLRSERLFLLYYCYKNVMLKIIYEKYIIQSLR